MSQTKQDLAEIKKQDDELLKIILKKTGVTYSSLIEFAKKEYIAANIDVLTPAEKKQFPNFVFDAL
ncbi:MAG: hypothetical protein LBD45_06440 [Bacteroidales bacterium]|jgi:hypothetical protein|nr:hypothetical protein [Bacteroidales bacterium]